MFGHAPQNSYPFVLCDFLAFRSNSMQTLIEMASDLPDNWCLYTHMVIQDASYFSQAILWQQSWVCYWHKNYFLKNIRCQSNTVKTSMLQYIYV